MSDSRTIELVGKVHGKFVYGRRKAALVQQLSIMLPPTAALLDVGCGDGTIGKLVGQSAPGMTVEGAEFIPRADCAIPCLGFDGEHLPYADESFDVCMFVDVLHHSRNALAILRDAARVSRKFVLIKDHLAESSLDHTTLRFMDWVGNRPHGVELPYNYFSNRQWQELYQGAGLREVNVEQKIPLYPFPFSAIFGRNLHFIALLEKIDR